MIIKGEGKGPIPSNFPLGLHQQNYESSEQVIYNFTALIKTTSNTY